MDRQLPEAARHRHPLHADRRAHLPPAGWQHRRGRSRGRHAPRAGRCLRRRRLGAPDRPPWRLRRHRGSRLLERGQRPRPRLGHTEPHALPRRREPDRRGRQGRAPGARAAPRRRSVCALRQDRAADRPHSPVHGGGIPAHAGTDTGAGLPGDPPGRSLQAPAARMHPRASARARRRGPRETPATSSERPPCSVRPSDPRSWWGAAASGPARRLRSPTSPSRPRCPSSREMRRGDSCPTAIPSATGDPPASASSSRTWYW